MAGLNIAEVVKAQNQAVHPVVRLSGQDIVAPLDLSRDNPDFTAGIYNDFNRFTAFINEQFTQTGATYLVGGYREIRDMYRRSELFGVTEEPRCLHLGIDIWGPAGTPVFAPLPGTIHSFRFNDNFGDYGATIIVHHQLGDHSFYILYGHLALADLANLEAGQPVKAGELLAHFGGPAENGHWPPHLHFQVIVEIGALKGDYPGVCTLGEADHYTANSPDPRALLPF